MWTAVPRRPRRAPADLLRRADAVAVDLATARAPRVELCAWQAWAGRAKLLGVLGLRLLIGLGIVAVLALFSTVFRRVREELVTARNRGVPRAFVPPPLGSPGAGWRGRLVASVPSVQAGIVASAAASILIMVFCLVGCLALAVLGR
jgi:hypothetical protein